MVDRESEKKKFQNNSKQSRKYTEDYFTKEVVLKPDENNYRDYISRVKSYSEELVRYKVTTSQVRNIFSLILPLDNPKSCWTIEPKLAYLAGRNESNQKLKFFVDRLIILIREIESPEELKNFKSFFEALVAYHKYNEKFKSQKGGK